MKRVSPVSLWPPPWIGGELSSDDSCAPEPVESLAGPCPTCGCAIGWRLSTGEVLCAACNDRPDDATKAVYVDDGTGWIGYAAERERHERRTEADDVADSWDGGELWTADTWHCPVCGSAASWESMADVLHCLTCEPPRRAKRLQRYASIIRRRYPVVGECE